MPKSIRQDHAEPPRIEMGDVPDNEVTQPRVRRSDIKPPPLPRRKKTK
jgi:hypothetical protein